MAPSIVGREGRAGLGRGVLLGPLVTLVVLLLSIQLRVGGATTSLVVGVLVVPAGCGIAAVATRRRYWVAAGVGAVLGSALALGVVVGLITAVTYLISDPVPAGS